MTGAARLACSFALALAACGGDDDGDDEAAIVQDSEAAEQPSAVSATCQPPPDCLPIVSLINLGVCCSDTLRCGLDLSPIAAIAPMYPELASMFELDPARPCTPRSRIFSEVNSPQPKRIAVDGGVDVLIAPTCLGRLFTATPMAGCCLNNNTCGYDTHLANGTFRELSGAAAGTFAVPRCLTATELNALLAANDLAAWSHVPKANGTCDYATLDAALK
jgi:hypothetical protein